MADKPANKLTEGEGALARQAAEREAALQAEIQSLKAQLAQQRAAGGGYTPAASPDDFPAAPGVPLKPFMVSLDHVHKGLTTPSVWFAREKPGDPRGAPIMAVSEEHARSIFYRLHGILGVSGALPAEVRAMSPEEVEAGEWEPPPQPGPKRETRVPEKPKLPRQKPGPSAARDAALADLLQG